MTSGILLVRKPTGISSAKALYPVKRSYPGRKIGHTGTLDPFASGLLVVLVGHATRLSRLFLTLDKRYVATIRFGRETDTHDPEGATVRESPLPDPDAVFRVRERFIGTLDQIPPAYSALKVNGTRSYDLARRGESHTLPSRPITVYDLNLVQQTTDTFEMSVHCGSGTYIRALARDIGRAAESAAYVETLCRTAVGPFALSTVPPEAENGAGEVISIADAITQLGTVPIITIPDSAAEQMRHGVPPEDALEERFPTEGTALRNDVPDTATLPGDTTTGDAPPGDTRPGVTTTGDTLPSGPRPLRPAYALCVTATREAVALLQGHAEQPGWRFAAVFPPEESK